MGKWYYTIKGDGGRHGVADDKTLIEMVRHGELKPTDLVWNKEGGSGWVPVSSLKDVLPPDVFMPRKAPEEPSASPMSSVMASRAAEAAGVAAAEPRAGLSPAKPLPRSAAILLVAGAVVLYVWAGVASWIRLYARTHPEVMRDRAAPGEAAPALPGQPASAAAP